MNTTAADRRRSPPRLLAAGVLIALCVFAHPARGQWIERLPSVIPPDSLLAQRYQAPPPLEELPTAMPAARLAYFDPNVDRARPQPAAPLEPPVAIPNGPQLPPGAKPGVLQRVVFTNTWLSGREPDDLGMFDSEFRFSLGFPFPTVETPLVVTPGVGVHLLDGPTTTDLPPRVYDMYLDVLWKYSFSPNWALDIAVTPGWYSDFEQSSSDALRIGGRAIGYYTPSPDLKFLLGAVYLDREDVSFLPIAGAIWTPREDIRLEFVVPKPRASWRTSVSGEYSTWWYIVGEFGGGTWAIQRASGADDVVNYSDLRISIGQELKRCSDSIAWIDIGYVFNRQLSYNSGTPDFEPDSTIVVRAGLGY